MWKIIILCITMTIVTISSAAVDKVSYKGYKLFSIIPKEHKHLKLLENFKMNLSKYKFWQEPSILDREVLLMVPPHKLNQFYQTMDTYNVPFEIKIGDIQTLIDDTIPKNQSGGFDFKSYHTLEEIYDNLEELAKNYPNNVQIITGGTTYEGRVIKGVNLTFNSFEKKNHQKKFDRGIFIEGGIHGREWIAPATVMYILHELLTSEDTLVRYVAENHNWYIFPVFNPDGYVFSHVKDRLWKKTRKPSSDTCIGSDPSRNWDFRWNGTDNNPCADNYPGSEPFSEIEIKTMSKYITSIRSSFYAYIAFQGFYQELLVPCTHTSEHFDLHNNLFYAEYAIGVLKQIYNTSYTTGCIGQYPPTSGVSTDYIAGHFLEKRHIFLYKLRGKAQYGFLLPPEQIIPTANETLYSLVTIFSLLLSFNFL